MTTAKQFRLQRLALLLGALFLAAPVFALVWQMKSGRSVPPPGVVGLYLPTGMEDSEDLFTLMRDSSGAFRISGASIPHDLSGVEISAMPVGAPTRALLGRYVYDFVVQAGVNESRVSWTLAGVTAGPGDEIGRNPAFHETTRLSYSVTREYRGTHRLPLWIDSLPARAFRILPLDSCNPVQGPACIEITGGTGRATLEQGSTAAFSRLEQGDVLGIAPEDRLWFGHVPFQVAKHGTGWVVIVDRDRIARGKSVFLGSLVAEGTARLPKGATLAVRDVTRQLKGTALPPTWWSPEMEDEYQLLIDEELLCVDLRDVNGAPQAQLVWKSPVDRGCRDFIAEVGAGRAQAMTDPTVSAALIDMYEQRRQHDTLVRRANAVLSSTSSVMSADALPFVFEWWPVDVGGRLELMPVKVWGVRTQATQGPLWSEASTAHTDPALVTRDGRRLAVTDQQQRLYRRADGLAGLGPLLGYRGALDGLDARTLPATSADGVHTELTIDFELQKDLWRLLKEQLALLPDPNQTRSSTWGVTAVAMDPANGDVLAVLNWPEGLAFEQEDALANLRSGALGGQVLESMNRAMLRDQDVGSAFKLMVMLAMADAGVLDGDNAPTQSTAYQAVFRGPFAAALTDASGHVQRPGQAYLDNQEGPGPLGAEGMRRGLAAAAGASSNTFFAFASMMLLSDEIPAVSYASTCPIDIRTLRRTDNASAGGWVICRSGSALNSALGITQSVKGATRAVAASAATLLLTPAGQILTERAQAPFMGKSRKGYFRTALNGGYTFLAHTARQGREPGRAPGVDGESLKEYEGHPRWRAWFPELPFAEGRVFRYPAIYSPGSFFSSSTERFDSHAVPSTPRGWRGFAQQAIGEDGQGSALSLAVLYAAVLRDDGMFVAPRLLTNAGAPQLSQAYAGATPEITKARAMRLREALAKPLAGTAARLGSAARAIELPLLGKTGTFSLTQRLASAAHGGSGGLEQCGVLAWNAGLKPGARADWRAGVGSTRCEKALPAVTLVHHYPANRPELSAETSAPVPVAEEEFTSFVALIEPEPLRGTPAYRPGKRMVLAVISDIEGVRAANLVQGLLPSLKRWYLR